MPLVGPFQGRLAFGAHARLQEFHKLPFKLWIPDICLDMGVQDTLVLKGYRVHTHNRPPRPLGFFLLP